MNWFTLESTLQSIKKKTETAEIYTYICIRLSFQIWVSRPRVDVYCSKLKNYFKNVGFNFLSNTKFLSALCVEASIMRTKVSQFSTTHQHLFIRLNTFLFLNPALVGLFWFTIGGGGGWVTPPSPWYLRRLGIYKVVFHKFIDQLFEPDPMKKELSPFYKDVKKDSMIHVFELVLITYFQAKSKAQSKSKGQEEEFSQGKNFKFQKIKFTILLPTNLYCTVRFFIWLRWQIVRKINIESH